MAHYAPEVITFDIVPPLASKGADNYRKSWEMWFDSIEGPIEYEMRDLTINASGDVAFCHSLNHVSSVSKKAGKEETWLRATVGFKKINGEWLVTHEHVSLPFDMETGKAALDLEP
jgi:ketosteroid isomerase-like protein